MFPTSVLSLLLIGMLVCGCARVDAVSERSEEFQPEMTLPRTEESFDSGDAHCPDCVEPAVSADEAR
jgi:hypothetical protein